MIDNLFCSVGAMKAGTTWLHRQLVLHPDIFFTPEKEVHFLSDPKGQSGAMQLANRVERFKRVCQNLNTNHITPRVRRNLRWYINKYLANRVDNEWYVGLFDQRDHETYVADFSNLYCLLEEAGWKNARRCARKIKVLFTMRSPIDRLWSHVKFHHNITEQTLGEHTFSVTDWERLANVPGISPYGNYEEAIMRLQSSLEKDELMFQYFETVRENPVESLRDIEKHLVVRAHNYASSRIGSVVNPSSKAPIPVEFYDFAIRFHADQIDRLQKLGFTPPQSWQPQVAYS